MTFQRKIKYFLIITLILVPLVSFGQLPDIGKDLLVTLNPSVPEPNQNVFISIENYSFDLSKSSITWFVNGVVQSQFSGKKSFSFKAGDLGSSTVINISVTTPSGNLVEERIVIRPSDIDLLWEASSYTPPFYKGKALHSPRGIIKVVALAEVVGSGGFRLGKNSLDYTWKRNGEVLRSLSGVGENTLTLAGSVVSFGFTKVDLEIKEAGKETLLARKSLQVNEAFPKIVFYENHPLLGINFDNALQKTFSLGKEELEIKASPYFFSKESMDNLNYRWRINKKRVSGDKDTLLVRVVKEKGLSSISLQIENALNALQLGSASFFIEFGNNI